MFVLMFILFFLISIDFFIVVMFVLFGMWIIMVEKEFFIMFCRIGDCVNFLIRII